jgi:hypothetical protein
MIRVFFIRLGQKRFICLLRSASGGEGKGGCFTKRHESLTSSSSLFDLGELLPRRSELFVLVTEYIRLYVLGTPSSQADIDICDRD